MNEHDIDPVKPGVIRDSKGQFVPGVSGNPKGPGPGYKKKMNRIYETIIDTFESIGGAAAYAEWAKRNKHEFYKSIIALLPKESKVELTGEEGNRIVIEFIDANTNQGDQRTAQESCSMEQPAI